MRCPFPTDVSIHEEDEVFALLAALGPIGFCDEVVSTLQLHAGSRLSDTLGTLTAESAWIRIVERVWGTNERFLSEYDDEYRELLEGLLLERARSHLVRGMGGKAREDLARVRTAPLHLKAAAHFPSLILRTLVAVRKRVRQRRGI